MPLHFSILLKIEIYHVNNFTQFFFRRPCHLSMERWKALCFFKVWGKIWHRQNKECMNRFLFYLTCCYFYPIIWVSGNCKSIISLVRKFVVASIYRILSKVSWVTFSVIKELRIRCPEYRILFKVNWVTFSLTKGLRYPENLILLACIVTFLSAWARNWPFCMPWKLPSRSLVRTSWSLPHPISPTFCYIYYFMNFVQCLLQIGIYSL